MSYRNHLLVSQILQYREKVKVGSYIIVLQLICTKQRYFKAFDRLLQYRIQFQFQIAIYLHTIIFRDFLLTKNNLSKMS